MSRYERALTMYNCCNQIVYFLIDGVCIWEFECGRYLTATVCLMCTLKKKDDRCVLSASIGWAYSWTYAKSVFYKVNVLHTMPCQNIDGDDLTISYVYV